MPVPLWVGALFLMDNFKTGLARPAAVEWPTLALAVLIYTSWGLLTFYHAALPWGLMIPLGAWLIAWQTSLQHEILHGHPTRWRGFNRALASVPLSLWLPYEGYRISHLIHHRDERLTDPFDDPETYYWTPQDWSRLSPLAHMFIKAQTTLAGRLLLGPLWIVPRYLWAEAKALWAGKAVAREVWLRHLPALALVLFWLVFICKINILFYVFGVVYPGTSLMLLRSFAEHRAAVNTKERTAIVENAGVLGWLFLFNNLHSVHHEEPMLPWYEIPAWYRRHRTRLLHENGGLVYNGYGEIVRRYLFRSHDAPIHPFGRAP